MFMLFSRGKKDQKLGVVAPKQLKFATMEEAEVVKARWEKAHPNSVFEIHQVVTVGEGTTAIITVPLAHEQ